MQVYKSLQEQESIEEPAEGNSILLEILGCLSLKQIEGLICARVGLSTTLYREVIEGVDSLIKRKDSEGFDKRMKVLEMENTALKDVVAKFLIKYNRERIY